MIKKRVNRRGVYVGNNNRTIHEFEDPENAKYPDFLRWLSWS